MGQTKITFSNTVNCSLQVGDTAYVSHVLPGGITSEPIEIGTVVDIGKNYIVINTDKSVIDTQFTLGIDGMFLMFSKRIEANSSSLKGYYADITFENSSNKSIELFSVGSEIDISSK
jgi:hypothetical protein